MKKSYAVIRQERRPRMDAESADICYTSEDYESCEKWLTDNFKNIVKDDDENMYTKFFTIIPIYTKL